MDRSGWPKLRERFTELFKQKTRAEWCELMEGTDACFAPVLTMTEAAEHPAHQGARHVVEHDGVLQPAPAPRFSRTTAEMHSRPGASPASTPTRCSAEWGFSADEIAKLRDAGAIA